MSFNAIALCFTQPHPCPLFIWSKSTQLSLTEQSVKACPLVATAAAALMHMVVIHAQTLYVAIFANWWRFEQDNLGDTVTLYLLEGKGRYKFTYQRLLIDAGQYLPTVLACDHLQ